MNPSAPSVASVPSHTPGPWHRGCSTRAGGVQIITADKNDEPNGLIAVVNAKHTIEPGKAISDEVRANACLIAAAPELLASVNLFVKFLASLNPGWLGKTSGDIGLLNDAYIQSAKAIAKATGGQQ
jgi:hypothetical protein